MNFLKSKYALVLTLALLAQAGVYYAAELRREKVPAVAPLTDFPAEVQGWTMVQNTPVEKEVLEVLKADDTLSRVYVDPAKTAGASLFLAFFKTQRAGQAPHSPKNCLPGSGWEPSETGTIDLQIPGEDAGPITINRYVVSRGEDKSVVLYWYQSRSRVIAGEFSAKLWLVADSIRFNRSDTALVRIVVPVRKNDEEGALRTGVEFVRAVFPALRKQLPS